MATKIRLARHGKKGSAFYHVVVADSRSPRDGRFIEKLGTYNPNTNPATIDINFDRAVYWMGVGAEPTDTTRAILSYRGVMMMHHLNGGVAKGALTEEQAKAKFEKWISEKEAAIEAKKSALSNASQKTAKERLEAESKVKDAKAKVVASKITAAAAAAKAEEAEEVAETVAEEAVEAVEAVEVAVEVAETKVEEVVEVAVAAEVVAEAKAEEVIEAVVAAEVVAEVAAEVVAEAKAEKTAAE